MNPISSAAPRITAPPVLRETEKPGGPAPQAEEGSSRDTYVPEEKRESYGRYWLGKDEAGGPKIYFDDPEAGDPASGVPENPERDEEPDAPEKAAPSGGDGGEEKCTADTDEVDREIKRLKEKKETLEARLGRERDETKREDLERRLAQVESELRQKDNDAYRRQHTKFTEG